MSSFSSSQLFKLNFNKDDIVPLTFIIEITFCAALWFPPPTSERCFRLKNKKNLSCIVTVEVTINEKSRSILFTPLLPLHPAESYVFEIQLGHLRRRSNGLYLQDSIYSSSFNTEGFVAPSLATSLLPLPSSSLFYFPIIKKESIPTEPPVLTPTTRFVSETKGFLRVFLWYEDSLSLFVIAHSDLSLLKLKKELPVQVPSLNCFTLEHFKLDLIIDKTYSFPLDSDLKVKGIQNNDIIQVTIRSQEELRKEENAALSFDRELDFDQILEQKIELAKKSGNFIEL